MLAPAAPPRPPHSKISILKTTKTETKRKPPPAPSRGTARGFAPVPRQPPPRPRPLLCGPPPAVTEPPRGLGATPCPCPAPPGAARPGGVPAAPTRLPQKRKRRGEAAGAPRGVLGDYGGGQPLNRPPPRGSAAPRRSPPSPGFGFKAGAFGGAGGGGPLLGSQRAGEGWGGSERAQALPPPPQGPRHSGGAPHSPQDGSEVSRSPPPASQLSRCDGSWALTRSRGLLGSALGSVWGRFWGWGLWAAPP